MAGRLHSFNHELQNFKVFLGGYTTANIEGALEMRDMDGNRTLDVISSGDIIGGNSSGILVELNQPFSEGAAYHRVKSIRSESGFGVHLRVRNEGIARSDHYSYQKGFARSSSDYSEEVCAPTQKGDSCWKRNLAYSNEGSFERSLKTPFWNVSSSIQKESSFPVIPVKSGITVVTEMSEKTHKAFDDYRNDQINTSYYKKKSFYYSGAKRQLGGVGALGFKSKVTIDHETGARQHIFIRQDWPFVGVRSYEKLFDKDGNVLSGVGSSWVISKCYDFKGALNSSCLSDFRDKFKRFGKSSVLPMRVNERSSSKYSENTFNWSTSSSSTVLSGYDQNGNKTYIKSQVYNDDQETLIHTEEKEFAYSYSGPTYSMQTGRLASQTTKAANDHGEKINYKEYGYYQSGSNIGKLKRILDNPDHENLYKITDIFYDNFGNETRTLHLDVKTDEMRNSPENVFDSKGRYPKNTYHWRKVGEGNKYLSTEVVSRSALGMPTEVKYYKADGKSVKELIGYTDFGTVYFRSNSAGQRKWVYASRSFYACPSYADVTIRTYGKDGSANLECYSQNLLVRTGQRDLSGAWVLVGMQYDALGKLVRQTTPYRYGAGAEYFTEYHYDDYGRLSYKTTPSEENGTSKTSFEYRDKLVITTNAKNNTEYEYKDALGQITKKRDALGNYTHYKYNAIGNLIEMKDVSNNITSMTYDIRGNKLTMDDPSKGYWEYKYNSFGEMACQKDAENQFVINSYDILGRIKRVVKFGAGGTCERRTGGVYSSAQWFYDDKAYGQLHLVKDSVTGYEKEFTYDKYGRPTITRTKAKGFESALENHYEKVTYNQYGQVYQYFDAARAGEVFDYNGVEYSYRNGHLQTIKDAVYKNGKSRKQYYHVSESDVFGAPKVVQYGDGLDQSVIRDGGSGLIRLVRADHFAKPFLIQDLGLDWDELGNLEERRERGAGVRIDFSLRNLTESFEYDDLNRLDRHTVINASTNVTDVYSLGLDKSGNILSRVNRGSRYSYKYGGQCNGSQKAGPHAVCNYSGSGINESYTYDNNGNMLSGGGRSINYDVSGLPTYISKSSHRTYFEYGPDGKRYRRQDKKFSSQATTLYIGSVQKVRGSKGAVVWKRSIGNFAQVNQSFDAAGKFTKEETKYFLRDHLGSTNYIVDEGGNVDQELDYDPWGQRRFGTTWRGKGQSDLISQHGIFTQPFTSLGFTNHEMLEDTRLIHMNGRIYDPLLARFIQADPIVQAPFQSQSHNRYSYVWNNPLNSIDPSGFFGINRGEGNSGTEGELSQNYADELADDLMRQINEGANNGTLTSESFRDLMSKLAEALGVDLEVNYGGAGGEVVTENFNADGTSNTGSTDFKVSGVGVSRGGNLTESVVLGEPPSTAGLEAASVESSVAKKNYERDYWAGAIASSNISIGIIGIGAGLVEVSKANWLKPPPGTIFYSHNPSLNSLYYGVAKKERHIFANSNQAFKMMGKLTLIGGVGIEMIQGGHNISKGANPTVEALKTTLDIEMAIVSAYFPVGTAFGASYFLLDNVIGWGVFRGDGPPVMESGSVGPTNY